MYAVKSEEEFIRFIRATGYSLTRWGDKFIDPHVEMAWKAWKQSRKALVPTMWVGTDSRTGLTTEDIAITYKHGDVFHASPWLQLAGETRFVVRYGPKGIQALATGGKL